jgi:predicted helicase
VIQALTSRHFSRSEFLGKLDRFYGAIETTAATIDDFSQKQGFLNTVYEKFFQGFSIKVADTHGIVYTPQPIVDFMVRSVDDILQKEFGQPQGLAATGVHILDPFVGTGNFILRIMRQIPKTQLAHKYAHELHCNEVMLLPYYIAAMNIEHDYLELTGQYAPFDGICLVDTFELAEGHQIPMFALANTERVDLQQKTPIFVIIGNPPYNVGQVNENDNNKNRSYPVIDKQVSETYAKDSAATNKNALSDVYVKAFRWASGRIGDEGIIAFVTNNSFVDDLSFDGMRKHLGQDFDRVYVLDLKGNIRKDSMRDGIPLGEKHTVFGLSAMVGIAITILVKGKQFTDKKIYYSTIDFRATRLEKFELLEKAVSIKNVDWLEIKPNSKNVWLTAELEADFDTFLPMGTKEAKAGEGDAIFTNYGRGIATSRDTWAYNFNRTELAQNIQRIIETYNDHVHRWARLGQKSTIDDFVLNDATKISWSRDLKLDLKRGNLAEFNESKLRKAIYRPYSRRYLFFDRVVNEEVYQFPSIFPNTLAEDENLVICVPGTGNRKLFGCLLTNLLPALDLAFEKTQCFPFYTYNEDGSNRRENITAWALEQFRERYAPSPPNPSPNGRGDAAGAHRARQRRGAGNYQVGHLLLRLRAVTSSHLPRNLRRQPASGTAALALRPGFLGVCPGRASPGRLACPL